MKNSILIEVGHGLYGIGKLSNDTFRDLFDSSDICEFHKVILNEGVEAADLWLSTYGYDSILPLTFEDIGSESIHNWLITRVELRSAINNDYLSGQLLPGVCYA